MNGPRTQPKSEVSDATLVMLWAHYTVAARRAQQSLRYDDSYEAGRAWAAWLNVFATVPKVQPSVLPQPMPVQP